LIPIISNDQKVGKTPRFLSHDRKRSGFKGWTAYEVRKLVVFIVSV